VENFIVNYMTAYYGMKRFVINMFLLFLLCVCSAQTYSQPHVDKKAITYHPKFFIGPGHGINAYTGLLGLTAEFPVDDHFTMFFSGGIGSWGYKAGGGAAVYPVKINNGPSFSLGYVWVSGIRNYTVQLETITGEPEYVTLELKPLGNIQLLFNYNIPAGGSRKMTIGTGYSVKLHKNVYNIMSGHRLSDDGKQMMNLLQPGGLIMSFTYFFGIR
jgi:hypothetical protein